MDRDSSRAAVESFVTSRVDRHTLGLVYGRRRIGKSTLLEANAREHQGFYWEATRTEPAIQLARLGEALGRHLGVGTLALSNWEEALRAVLRIPRSAPAPIVLDEFGHVLEADKSVDSVIATILGPGGAKPDGAPARLILCGSAIGLLGSLTAGEAPLRGRAGMELVMQPWDFRQAAQWLGSRPDLALATYVFAVIGGVVGYATDMVDHDLPADRDDFDRWIGTRLLSPAATLHHEATTLLAEDPTLSARSPVIHHSILTAIANGDVSAGKIANQLRRSVSAIDPALKRLVDAGFVVRQEDPIRAQRPLYTLADPFLQFHYAVLEPHGQLLRDRSPQTVWERHLRKTFDSRVRGPVFEAQARAWVRRFADERTIGGLAVHSGPSAVVYGGVEHQLDVVIAAANDEPPGQRDVLAIGEAKAGETGSHAHLRALERARAAIGTRAAHAKLLIFAPDFTSEVRAESDKRTDVELIDLERLYYGE